MVLKLFIGISTVLLRCMVFFEVERTGVDIYRFNSSVNFESSLITFPLFSMIVYLPVLFLSERKRFRCFPELLSI